MTTDVLALREALLEAKTFIEAVEWEDSHTVDKVQDWMGRAEAALAAVRAETLAGSGVCARCGNNRDHSYHTACSVHGPDGWDTCHPFKPATPPTPALTAARLEPYYLLPPIPPRDWDDALHNEWAIDGGLTDEGLARLRALIDPAALAAPAPEVER